jgi:hypothetical protein
MSWLQQPSRKAWADSSHSNEACTRAFVAEVQVARLADQCQDPVMQPLEEV